MYYVQINVSHVNQRWLPFLIVGSSVPILSILESSGLPTELPTVYGEFTFTMVILTLISQPIAPSKSRAQYVLNIDAYTYMRPYTTKTISSPKD